MAWNFDDLQREQVEWVKRNFGDRPAWWPLLGLAEEVLDELLEAEEKQDKPAIADALADAVIFMSDFCQAMGFDMHVVQALAVKITERKGNAASIFPHIGRLMRHYLKMSQGIRGTEAEHRAGMAAECVQILRQLDECALFYDFDLVELTRQTWLEVQKRDWTKNKATGQVDVEA